MRELAGGPDRADRLAGILVDQYEALIEDEVALRAMIFLVALVVCTRGTDVAAQMRNRYDIEMVGDDLDQAIGSFIPEDHPMKNALAATVRNVEQQPSATLLPQDPWTKWREYDGRAFCDLARLFFCNVNDQYFSLLVEHEELATFGWEMSLITRTFSARWFNACARNEVPEIGSIRWYLGHCLGKLQLELEREKSDWVEPTGNPWKRRRKNPNAKLL